VFLTGDPPPTFLCSSVVCFRKVSSFGLGVDLTPVETTQWPPPIFVYFFFCEVWSLVIWVALCRSGCSFGCFCGVWGLVFNGLVYFTLCGWGEPFWFVFFLEKFFFFFCVARIFHGLSGGGRPPRFSFQPPSLNFTGVVGETTPTPPFSNKKPPVGVFINHKH